MRQTVQVGSGRKGKSGQNKYDISFKRHLIKEYIEGDQSIGQLSVRYAIPRTTINGWYKLYSSDIASTEVIIPPMTDQEQQELEALKVENEALKKKLAHADMKAVALETMIDVAEQQLG